MHVGYELDLWEDGLIFRRHLHTRCLAAVRKTEDQTSAFVPRHPGNDFGVIPSNLLQPS